MDILCLVIWILGLIDAVVRSVKKEPISSVQGICAILIVIIHYLERIIEVT
jgi:hypothetical protein